MSYPSEFTRQLTDFGTPMHSSAQIQAVYQRPVKEVENVFGRATSTSLGNVDVSSSLRPQQYGPRFASSYSEQLPHAAQAVSFSSGQIVPESTRISRVCMNKQFEAVPFYERTFPIVDAFPVVPTMGEVGDDPRYKMQSTKTNQTEYRKICETPGVPNFKTVQPTYGL